MKTKYLQRAKKRDSYNAILIEFCKDMSGKANARIMRNDTCICQRDMKGSLAVLPIPFSEGVYDIELQVAEEAWTEETYNDLVIRTKQLNHLS